MSDADILAEWNVCLLDKEVPRKPYMKDGKQFWKLGEHKGEIEDIVEEEGHVQEEEQQVQCADKDALDEARKEHVEKAAKVQKTLVHLLRIDRWWCMLRAAKCP
jgi:hypothetical protein